MRLFAAIRHAVNPHHFYGGLWCANFYPALRRLGGEIVESRVDLLPASRFMHIAGNFTPEELAVRADITARILEEVKTAHARQPVDLFLSYFYNSHFDPAGFEEIHRLGIPTVNFYCNSIYQFGLVAEIAAKVQWSWHAEKDARAAYLSVGARPVWVQLAADPDVYRPMEGLGRKSAAVFVGQRYADRDRWLAALVRAGLPVEIYGLGWGAPDNGTGNDKLRAAEMEHLGRAVPVPGSAGAYLAVIREGIRSAGFVPTIIRTCRQWRYRSESHRLTPIIAPCARGPIPFDRPVTETFNRHEVVLNFSNVWADGRPGSRLIPHVRLRDFEAPMCGSTYLTGHTDEIGEFYELGKEIETYRTEEELIDKARYYLAHGTAAERLRVAACQRARRDHTWDRRFQQLFANIGVQA